MTYAKSQLTLWVLLGSLPWASSSMAMPGWATLLSGGFITCLLAVLQCMDPETTAVDSVLRSSLEYESDEGEHEHSD